MYFILSLIIFLGAYITNSNLWQLCNVSMFITFWVCQTCLRHFDTTKFVFHVLVGPKLFTRFGFQERDGKREKNISVKSMGIYVSLFEE